MLCCRGLFCRLGVVPFLFSICSIVTIIITYSVAVGNGHVYPFFPAISDTGGIPPESSIFGFFLSACAFLGFVSVVIRYYQFRFISEHNEEHRPRLECVNKLALVIGVISTAGALVVAAFQVISPVYFYILGICIQDSSVFCALSTYINSFSCILLKKRYFVVNFLLFKDRGKSLNMHIAGALAVFGFGVLYCFVQTYMTFKMMACGMNSKKLFLVRVLVAFLSLAFFTGNQVFGNLAGQASARDPPTDPSHDHAHWYPEDAGFVYNVLGNVSEWLMAFSFFLYFLTFIGEFNGVRMSFSIKNEDYSMLLPFQAEGGSGGAGDSQDDDDMITA